MLLTDEELNREIRIAENRLGVLRREWFVRNAGVWPPVGWIGGDNTGSDECKEVNTNAVARMKEFGV
jgi:hypothetical protein